MATFWVVCGRFGSFAGVWGASGLGGVRKAAGVLGRERGNLVAATDRHQGKLDRPAAAEETGKAVEDGGRRRRRGSPGAPPGTNSKSDTSWNLLCSTPPARAVRCAVLGAPACRMLSGACNSMLCPTAGACRRG